MIDKDQELQDFFEDITNNSIEDLNKKYKEYGIEFEEVEDTIDFIYKKSFDVPKSLGCETLRNLECKYQCNFSYEVTTLNDKELILNVEQIEDLIEKCGENICIYAPYCKLYKNFIKHATWYKKIRHNNNYRRINNSLNAVITSMYIRALYNLHMRIENKAEVLKLSYNNFKKSEIDVHIK